MTAADSLRPLAVLLCILAAAAAATIPTAAPGAEDPHAEKAPPAAKPKPPARPKPAPPGRKKPAAAAARKAPVAVAHIRLGGAVLPSPPDLALFPGQAQGTTLRKWLQRLARARNDSHVGAVLLEMDSPRMNFAQAQELADAVRRLDKVKPVHAHITSGGALSYLVASAGRRVTMEPTGELMIIGLGAELMFYKGTLEWLGIRPQMIQVGRYKGAAEPLTREGPSEAFRSQYEKVLDDLFLQLCRRLADQRNLTVPHVRYVIDQGPLTAREALEYRLVDRLVPTNRWRSAAMQAVAAAAKRPAAELLEDYGAEKRRTLDFSNPLAVFSLMMGPARSVRTQDPTLAVIHADGILVEGDSSESLLGARRVGARTLTKCFRLAETDRNVKAVIFRVNSPGGSALASEMIYQAARRCAEKKPVIVSIASLGASGGYYVALGGKTILADEAALVGSIGVVAGKLPLTGLLEKIGVTTFAITRGRNAGLDLARPWNDREIARIRTLAERTYRTFTDRVRQARGRRVADIEAVAQGRIFTARQAVENGLVDRVGGFRDAVAAACSAAKIQAAHFLVLPRPRTLFDVLYGGGPAASAPGAGPLGKLAGTLPAALAADGADLTGAAYMLQFARMLGRRGILTALPYHVRIQP